MTELETFSFAWWEVFLAGVATLGIYSFLYKENILYRIFEHAFIGIATAWGIVATVREFLWPKVLKTLFGYSVITFPDGTLQEPYQQAYLLYLFPMAFGLLYYFILTRRYNWLAQMVIAFQLGCSGGLAFKGVFTELLPQMYDSFRPLYVPNALAESLTNIAFTTTLVCCMTYFFFTFKRKTGGIVEGSSHLGRWLMMGCFGAFFGSTIMARMALLVERLDFLIHDWIRTLA